MKRWAAAFVAALACWASGLSQAQNGEMQPSPGAWPTRTYRWWHNPADHPAWLSAHDARQLLVEASQSWEACGIRMEFVGETDRAPGAMDGVNVVGWRQELPRQVRGLTQGRALRGKLVERDIAFSAARAEFQRFPTLLRKVMVHEFGHAIGLTHSAACNDVMTLAADCAPADPRNLPVQPTAHDLERCRAIYSAP